MRQKTDAVKFSTFHAGYLAFRNGHSLKTIQRKIKVFASEASAWKALDKCRSVALGFGKRSW